jgi:hypothetical protein
MPPGIPGGGPGGRMPPGGPGGLGWPDASLQFQANKARATTKAAIGVRILMVLSLDAHGLG